MKQQEQYDEIRVLDFPECIRRRWSIYIDSPSMMLREAIDNATDEFISWPDPKNNLIVVDNAGYGGFNVVADRGRGIPILMSKDRPGQTQADVAVSTMHAGSKFVTSTNITTGLNGVGVSASNALSSQFVVLSKITPGNYNKSLPCVKEFYESLGPRGKKEIFYYAYYERGLKKSEGATKKKDIEKLLGLPKPLPADMSTIVAFKVDPTIFPTPKTEIPLENLTNFLFIQEKFYRRKVTVTANDGVLSAAGYVPYKFEVLRTITPADPSMNPYLGVYATFEVDPALSPKSVRGSVNGLVCDGGAHVTALERCYEDALRGEYKISHKTIFPGLRLKVILLAEELVYDSQNKSRLKSISKVRQADFGEVTKEIQKIFRKNDDYWRPHVEKLNALAESYKSIGAVEKAQKMIDAATKGYKMKGQNYVEGFSDATTSRRWDAELFLCEGLSAAGGLKSGRKSTLLHAVLPLRGKILNVKDSTVDEALANKEIYTLLSTIGLGIDINYVGSKCSTPEETYQEIQKHSRYGKIIIATDADSDGAHIANLILYLIGKYSQFLLRYGMVYILQSPLYEQGGKFWFPGDPLQKGSGFPVGLDPKKHFRRFKGLGSIPKELVYDAFYNPATRRLIQVTPDGMDYFLSLVENIDVRKNLLIQAGILGDPYNLNGV